MAQDLQKKTTYWGRISPHLKENFRVVARVMASGKTLVFLLIVAMGIAGSLVYAKVWRPLQAEVQLPSGVPVNNPMIDRMLLQRLAEGLTIRRRHVPASYFQATSIFAPTTPGQAPLEGQSDGQDEP